MHFNTETVDVVSNNKGQMSGILVRKVDTQEESVLEAKGLFYGIGHSPNSQLLEGQVDLDSAGYILVEEGTAKTSVEGVFAAGDVQVIVQTILFVTLTLLSIDQHADLTLNVRIYSEMQMHECNVTLIETTTFLLNHSP